MAKKNRQGVIPIGNWNKSGLSYSKYSGNEDSLYKMVGVDVHSTPGILQAAQKLTRETTPPTEYIKCQVISTNGRTYHFSSTTGKIWEEVSGTYTLVLTTTAAAGGVACLGAYEYQGYIYWATESRLHRILATDAEGATEWAANKALNWATFTITDDEFHPMIEQNQVLYIGDGNYLAQVDTSVVNEIPGGAINGANVTFTTSYVFKHDSLRVYQNDVALINGVDFTEVAGYQSFTMTTAPISGDILFVEYGTSSAVFSAEALDIKTPLRIKSLGKIATDVLLGTYIDDNVNKTEVIRWNTWSVSFTNSDPIDEVGINSFLPMDNFVLVSAGVAGNIYLYDGVKLELYRKVPGSYSSTATATINPNAVANLNGNVLFGMSNISGNSVDQGVYQIARHSRDFKYILDMPYPLSIRSGDDFVLTGIEIGSILVKGQNVYTSWKRSVTATMTIATPCVVTYTAHDITNGDAIVFTTTGALPTGITSGTVYFARSTGTNTLNIYDTAAHAVTGGATGRVDTTGTQSGVHTAATVGIDKIDYSNKLDGAYIETRVMTVERETEENISNLLVAYASLPTSTDVDISYDKNYTGSYTDATTVTDTTRKIIDADSEGITANTLQMKLTLTTNSNDSPLIESSGVFTR